MAYGYSQKYDQTEADDTPRRDSLYYDDRSANRPQDSILYPLNFQDSLMTTEESPRDISPADSKRPKKMPKRSMNMYEATVKLDEIQKKFGGESNPKRDKNGAPAQKEVNFGVGGKAKEVEIVYRKETEVRTAV